MGDGSNPVDDDEVAGLKSTGIAPTIDPTTASGETTIDSDDEGSGARRPLAPGTLIDGLQVMRLLGRGGMGEVYLARDLTLGRKVALKRLRWTSEDAVGTLMTEARALARFSHPHIVTIYAVGQYDGAPYLALEYLEGEDLASRLSRKAPTIGEALRISAAIADALGAAHGAGVLHRDLKPGNVMLPGDGRLRVVDFGLARQIDAERRVRRRGISGTPGYMAPEQWRGEPCTPATDVWALGVMIFEMVTGERPFKGQSNADIAGATTGAMPAPALLARLDALPDGLSAFVARCLSKPPKERPSVAEARSTLHRMVRPAVPTAASDDGPYRGLEPFTERHASVFFGRDDELSTATDRLEHAPVLLLLGPSGAGKSSFVNAGLVPRLRERDRWLVINLRPGARPFRTLARRLAALPDPPQLDAVGLHRHPRALGQALRILARRIGRPILLFVDQFEEAFTLSNDRDASLRFVEAVCLAADDPADPVRVVATVREAFLGRIAASAAGRLAIRHLMILRRPAPAALVEILERPLSLVGHRFEDKAMVDEMVASVAHSPAGLALLEFAARQLWEARDRHARQLTRAALDALGGVEGVLARHADRVLASFSDLRPVRALCLRLVTPDLTRRTMTRDALLDGLEPTAGQALDRLIDARLVTVHRADGEVDVELTHESLITHWHRLRRWIEASGDDLAVLAEIEDGAALWARRGRRPSELWAGDALREARRAIDRLDRPSVEARVFIEAGEHLQRRQRRRRRTLLGALIASLALVALVLGVQGRRADRARDVARAQTRVAEDQRKEARAHQAAALRASARAAHGAGRPFEARVRLRAAMEIEDHPSSRYLWQTLRDEPLMWQRRVDTYVFGGAMSPDGHRVALATTDGSLRIFDFRDGSQTRARGPGASVVDMVWPSAENLYAVGGPGLIEWALPQRTARVVDGTAGPGAAGITTLADGALVFVLDGVVSLCMPPCETIEPIAPMVVARIAVAAPTARRVVLTGGRGVVQLVDIDRAEVHAIGGEPSLYMRPTVFVDDETLVIGNLPHAGQVSRVRLRDGRPTAPEVIWALPERTPAANSVRRIEYDRASGHIALGDTGGLVQVGPLDGELIEIGQHTRHVTFVGFAADGALLSIDADGAMKLWRVPPPPGADRVELPPSQGKNMLGVSAGGRIATAVGRSIRIWSPDGTLERTWTVDLPGLWGVDFIAGTDRLIAWIKHTWFEGTPDRAHLVEGRAGPSGSEPLVPVFGSSGLIWSTDAEGQLIARPLEGVPKDPLQTLAIDNARRLVLAWNSERIGLWSADGGQPRWLAETGDFALTSGAFGAGGRLAFVGDWRGRLRVIDVASGRIVRDFVVPDAGIQELTATDEALYVATGDGHIHRWMLDDWAHIAWRTRRGKITDLAIDADGRTLIAVGIDGTVRRFDLDLNPVWRVRTIVVDASDPTGPWLATHHGWRGGTTSHPAWADQPWARAALDAASGAVSEHVACLASVDGRLSRWSRRDAGRAETTGPASIVGGWPAIYAVGDTCLYHQSSRVLIWPAGAKAPSEPSALIDIADPKTLEGVHITRLDDGFALVVGERLIVLDGQGHLRATHTVPIGVTRIAPLGVDDWIFGFSDGAIERFAPDPETGALVQAGTFDDATHSPVTAILSTPRKTLAVGHANGRVALWSLDDRHALREEALHGAVTDIAMSGRRLLITSEVGDHVIWSLGALLDKHCELLRRLWAETPSIWTVSGPEHRPDPDHHCALDAPPEKPSDTAP